MNIFRITDGTTTINLLTASPIVGTTYVPVAPSPQVTRFASALMDGDVINAVSRHNVVESVSLILEGTSSAMESLRTSIQRLLWQAEQRQKWGAGTVVYVEYQETSGDDTYRSELVGGAVEYAEALVRRSRSTSESQVELIINWERAWFWESTTESQVATRVKNGTAGSYTATNKTIYNREVFSGGTLYGNYLEIAAGGIGGDLPAPARIYLKNLSGADRAISEYLFFNQWQMGLFSTGKLFVEGESGTGGTTVADASCSESNKSRMTSVPSGTVWSLGVSAFPATAERMYVMPVVRFAAFTENVVWADFRFISYLHSYAELGVQTEPQVLSTVGDLQVFDALPMLTKGNISIAMVMRSENNVTVDLDYIYFAPVDSVRRLRTVGLKLVNSGKMIDYGNGVTELLDNLDVNYGYVAPVGPPLMLMPGVGQRVNFLASGDGSSPSWSFEAALYYRKRVLVP